MKENKLSWKGMSGGMRTLVWIGICVLFGAQTQLAGQSYSVTGTTFTGYSLFEQYYLIDAHRPVDLVNGVPFDSVTYNRWYMKVQATGSVSGDVSGASRKLRMVFRIIDQTTLNPVPLEDISTGQIVTELASEEQTIVGNGSALFTGSLPVPLASRLDKNRTYRVEARIQQEFSTLQYNGSFFFLQFDWDDRGSPHTSFFARNIVHFKGPWGSDSALNVVVKATSVSHTRMYALRNVPGQSKFAATVNYEIHRYDQPTANDDTKDPVPVRVTLELIDSADPGNPVPLVTSVFTESPPVSRVTSGSPPSPAPVETRSMVVEYEPQVQLDSVSSSYSVRATVEHLEQAPSNWVSAATRSSSSSRLIHLNGNLNFGSIQTTITGVTGVSAPGSISGSLNQTSATGVTGTLNGGSHSFGPSGINISVNAAGDAFIRSPSTVTLGPPGSPDRGTVGGISFDRGTITLSTSGASVDNVSLILPAGLGIGQFFNSKRVDGRVFLSGPIALQQNLRPILNQTANFAFPRWAVEESKPVMMSVNGLQWDIANGILRLLPSATGQAIYVRKAEMDAVDAAPVPVNDKIRRSNEVYYRGVGTVEPTIEVVAGFNAGAEMTATINIDAPVKVIGHFPYDVRFDLNKGLIEVENDQITTASFLELTTGEVTLPWSAGCTEPDCDPSGGSDNALLLQAPLDAGVFKLGVAADGGLYSEVDVPLGLELRWGYIPSMADYAHQVVDVQTKGRLAISGHFVNGADTLGGTIGQLFGPGTILLSGYEPDGKIEERPQLTFDMTTPYSLGHADYAGLNLRLGPPDSNDSGIAGRSLLGGEEYGPYALKNRSKYYVRKSGVSGIHDKVPTAPEAIPIYGYDITLTNFGLAFLSNDNVESRTNGNVYLPYPSDVKIDFDELLFLCNGGLDKVTVGAGSTELDLAYWLAPIDLFTMQFVSGNDCDVGEGYLTLGIHAYSSHVEDPLQGVVGVFNNGNFIPKQFSDGVGGNLTGLDSRLKLPTQTTFRGPKRQTTQGGDEVYYFTPTVDAYFDNPGLPTNDYAFSSAQHPAGNGFVNLAGHLKVSFFEAMHVHLQTSSNRPPGPGDPVGAWGTSGIHVMNGKWQISGSTRSYFDAGYHDTWNRGSPYPASGGGNSDSLSTYRESTGYYPFVRQSWLGGAIVLKYKVKWNTTTRSFVSLDADESVDGDDGYGAGETKKFVILEIDHRLKYLSAERAELTFGASYDGLPTINLTNFVVNQVDEATGVFKAATDAGLDVVFDTVNSAIDELAATLNDNMRGYLEQIVEDPVDDFVDTVYVYLQDQWNMAGSTWRELGVPPNLNTLMQTTLQTQVIDKLNPSVGAAQDQISVLLDILTEMENGLIIIRDDFLATDPGTQQLMAIRTLTAELIKVLSQELGGTLGSILDASGVDERLNDLIDPHLEDVKPTVAQIYSIVSDLTDVVTQIRGTLDGVVNFDFEQQLQGIFDNAMVGVDAEITQVKADIQATVMASLGDYGPAVDEGVNFLARDPEEVKLLIKNAIYDFVIDTVMIEKIQLAIKQRLQDVERSIRQGIDNAFAEVNGLVKESISDFLSEIDDKINGAMGSVSDKMGSGSLTGYAIFNGDAMRKVRIDGKFEFQIPSETTITAFLEINQYTSIDQPPGCLVLGEGEAYTEVEIGALDVGCDFISPDLRVNVSVKFAMKSEGSGPWSLRPDGFGGAFEMASGEISFEAFKITELKCGIMFSSTEAYVTAALGMKFGSYGAKGGVFFGRTCTLDPIMLWDPLVASAIGEPNPSFTGAYVYGEAHIPVSEVILGIPASCIFKITADVGAGFFFFIEGPTYGARLGLGVGGEVLCLVSIGGRVDMVGARVGSVTRLKGKGSVEGEIGPCSFCIKFKKSVEMESEIGSDGAMAGKGGTK